MTASSGTAGTADGTERLGPLTPAAIDHARHRGISQATLELFGVRSGTAYFPTLDRRSEALFVPYRIKGEIVNYKAIAFPDKAFISMKGGKQVLLNFDNVVRQEQVYFTEGEFDAMALVEAGVPFERVTSVPAGAREHQAQKDDDGKPRGYGWMEEALAAGLCNARRFVWCGDMDDPGLTLRHEICGILGAGRFYFVDWPEGAKDADDMLRADGAAALLDLVVNGPQPWPVVGLYRMSELPEPPPLTLWMPGFPEWEGKVRLAPRTASVVTGHPGHGKTQLFAQIWFNVVRAYEVGACIATFETRAKPHWRRMLRTLYCGRLECDLTAEEIARADRWIEERFTWMEFGRDPKSPAPTLDQVLELAEVAVIRHGARIVQIDPWNRLYSAKEPREPETDYILRCLRALYAFATQMNCHVQVVAHPAKMEGNRRTSAPLLEDIAGSKHWDNILDQGFAVHRSKMFADGKRLTDCELHVRKARFPELGYQCRLNLKYDLATGRYVSTDYESAHGGRP